MNGKNLLEKFITAKEARDRQSQGTKEYHAFRDYKKNKRFLKIRVPEWERKIKKENEERMANYTVGKEYSIGFQKFTISTVLGDNDDVDVYLEEMDGIGMREITHMYNNVVGTKEYKEHQEKQGKGGYTANKTNKTKTDYTARKDTYKKQYNKPQGKKNGSPQGNELVDEKGFGSGKQWDKVIEMGYEPDDFGDYAELSSTIAKG